jgi:hypothetical protein
VIALALLFMFGSAGFATVIALQNRHAVVQIQVGDIVWTGHLYAVFIAGALAACWFLLGAAFIWCRWTERCARRRVERASVAAAGHRELHDLVHA